MIGVRAGAGEVREGGRALATGGAADLAAGARGAERDRESPAVPAERAAAAARAGTGADGRLAAADRRAPGPAVGGRLPGWAAEGLEVEMAVGWVPGRAREALDGPVASDPVLARDAAVDGPLAWAPPRARGAVDGPVGWRPLRARGAVDGPVAWRPLRPPEAEVVELGGAAARGPVRPRGPEPADVGGAAAWRPVRVRGAEAEGPVVRSRLPARATEVVEVG